MPLPKHIKARPTLRGLQLQPKESDCDPPNVLFYPWDRAVRRVDQTIASTWEVYDADGRAIRKDGRRFYLDVSGRRANQLAKRAYQRALKRILRGTDSHLVEEYPRPNRVMLAFLLTLCVLCVGASAAMMIPGLLRRLSEDQTLPLPPSYYLLLWMAALAMPVLFSALAVAVGWVFVPMARQNVSRARFSRRGIRAELWDASVVEQSWTSLSHAKSTLAEVCLTFTDGTTLRMPPTSRLRAILDLVGEKLHAAEMAQSQRLSRPVAARIGLYAVTGIIAVWFLTRLLHKDYGSPRDATSETGLFALRLAIIACYLVVLLLWSGALRLPARLRGVLRRVSGPSRPNLRGPRPN